MKFLLLIALLAQTTHAFSLRSLNPSQRIYCHRGSGFFLSQATNPNQVKLDDFVDKLFEDKWKVCKKKIKDFNAIFKDFYVYHERRDERADDLAILFKQLGNVDDEFDVKIICNTPDGININLSRPVLAHRSILCPSSRVFKYYLSAYNNTIDLLDVDKEVVKEIILFIYTLEFSDEIDKIFKKENMGEKLLYTALKYEITPLIDMCDRVLASLINNNNMPSLHYLGQTFGLKNVLETCNKPGFVHGYLKACALRGIAGGEYEEGVSGDM